MIDLKDRDKFNATLNTYLIPDHMHGALWNYLHYGIEPGGFLSAVLQNDLTGAYSCADQKNTYAMRDWVLLLYNEIPHGAWGSLGKFHNWMQAIRVREEAANG